MRHRRLRRRAVLAGLAAAVAAPNAATATSWPSRSVSLISPFAAGGQSDAIGRLVAQHLQSVFGQPFILENRVGAGGAVGAQTVAKAEPDGHTILFGTTSTFAVIPAVSRRVGYDPVTSFAPITIATEGAMVLCANPDRPFKTVAELIEAARTKPGAITYASAGSGSFPHLLAELFASEARIRIIHVPYRGGAPAMNDLIAGQVDLMFEQIANVAQNAMAGKIVPLFQTGTVPSALLPNVPTARSVGLAALSLMSWTGFAAPARTPTPIVEQIGEEIRRALSTPDARSLASNLGISIVGSSGPTMAARISGELSIYRSVASGSSITIE